MSRFSRFSGFSRRFWRNSRGFSSVPPTMSTAHVMQRLSTLKSDIGRSVVAGFALTTVTVTGLVVLFWEDIANVLSSRTADVASKSLAEKQLQQSAHVLTQQVLAQLVQDERTLGLLRGLLNDDRTQDMLDAALFRATRTLLANERLQAQVGNVVVEILRRPEVEAAMGRMVEHVLQRPDVVATVRHTAAQVVTSEVVRSAALQLTGSILRDAGTKRNAGDLVYSATLHAVTPRFLTSVPKKHDDGGVEDGKVLGDDPQS